MQSGIAKTWNTPDLDKHASKRITHGLFVTETFMTWIENLCKFQASTVFPLSRKKPALFLDASRQKF